MGTKSPLAYPGGKRLAVQQILEYLPEGGSSVCSPFIGGGSVEIALAERGVSVVGYDCYKPLVDFWQELLTEPERLARAVVKYHPMSKAQFKILKSNMRRLAERFLSRQASAAGFYALNRTTFSGAVLRGGMRLNHPRFTRPQIDRLADFSVPNLSVYRADFHDSIPAHQHEFLYLDPPYWNKEKLYAAGDNADFDHHGLARLLTEREDWLLSYNDCPEVRRAYSDCTITEVVWPYSMGKNRRANELLIQQAPWNDD